MAIAAIVVVIYGYSFMQGKNLLDSNREFYAVYDNVEGLSSSANVTINGLKVGSVSEIRFLDKEGTLLVTMSVSNDFQFTTASIAEIYSDGFIGGNSIRIIPKHKGTRAQSGDTLRGHVQPGMIDGIVSQLDPLKQKLGRTLEGVDQLVHGLNKVLDTAGRQNLKRSLAKLNATMTHLNNSSAAIDKLLSENATQLDTTIGNLSATAYNFQKVSDSLAQADIAHLVHKFDVMLTNFKAISTKLNSGEGTIGKLLNDDQVYTNLEHATAQLEELVQDIKLNPRRYIDLKFSVFGGGKNKAAPYQKPEDPLK